MEGFLDILYFLSVPALVAFAAILLYRGEANHYQIVRATNGADQEKFEVYFRYESIDCESRNWRLEKTFATEREADEFIAQKFTTRETIREGKLKQ
jgi:hypothetical protein